jgi:small-conductance mechanosensitive channel
VGDLSVEARAAAIERRIARAMDAEDLGTDSLRLEPGTDAVDIFIGSVFITSVTDHDAHPLGRTRGQLAADRALILREALTADLAARSGHALLVSLAWSLVALAAALAAITLVFRGFGQVRRVLLEWAQHRTRDIHVRGMTVVSVKHALVLVNGAVDILRGLLILLITLVAAHFVLTRFPATQDLAHSGEKSVRQALAWAGNGLLTFLPNLLYLAIIILGTRYLLAAIRFTMDGVAGSRAVLANFPMEWVQPTYQILRFFVLALAAVMAFPFLPGFGSRAFQGVSVFVGIVLSLGSTAAIANLVAGIVLIYMRALSPGDRVRIGDTSGDVIACDRLALKIRTCENTEISIPNALVLGTHITNYSRQAAQGRLILRTSVTIGYDVPWQRVSELLIAAARATPNILADPPPFVLRTALEDSHVRHELNAYTATARDMAGMYSDLHTHILDCFHAAGVEIMSPRYSAVRDGNHVAMPEGNVPAGYQTPSFSVFWRRNARTGEVSAASRRSDPC